MVIRLGIILAALLTATAAPAAETTGQVPAETIGQVPAEATGQVPAEATTPAEAAAPVSAQAAFDDLIERSRHVEAIEWGQRVVDEAREGNDPLVLAAAHAQLASALRQAGDPVNAGANYEAAVRILEIETGFENKDLASAQLGLSRALADAGAYEEAAESYKKAADLIRATHGVRSLEQVNAITELSEIYYQLGKYSKADGLQKNYVKLLKKAHPDDPMKTVPALYSRADMLMRSGELRKAGENYRRIARIVEKSEGGESLQLLPALYNLSVVHTTQELALRQDLYRDAHKYVGGTKRSKSRIIGDNSDQRVGSEIVGGLSTFNPVRRAADNKVEHLALAYKTLKRAINVAERNPDANPVEKADAHIAMGDFLTLMTRDRVSAAQSYTSAWNYLDDVSLQDRRDERFANPVPLNDVPVVWEPAMRSLVSREPGEGDERGVVEVAYDVNDEGRSENVRVVSSDPAGYKDRLIVQHIKHMVFRPQFADGRSVETLDNRFEISYSYSPDDVPAG